jgi:hypothetical protein
MHYQIESQAADVIFVGEQLGREAKAGYCTCAALTENSDACTLFSTIQSDGACHHAHAVCPTIPGMVYTVKVRIDLSEFLSYDALGDAGSSSL